MNIQTTLGAAVSPPATTPTIASDELSGQSASLPIAQLVGQVYESAAPAERSRLLEHLLRPLNLLSLAVVANGVFAEFGFRGGWSDLQVRLEDAQKVHVNDVIALVDYVQQVSFESVNAITRMLMVSPLVAGSATTALLVTAFLQCAQIHKAGDGEVSNSQATPA